MTQVLFFDVFSETDPHINAAEKFALGQFMQGEAISPFLNL